MSESSYLTRFVSLDRTISGRWVILVLVDLALKYILTELVTVKLHHWSIMMILHVLRYGTLFLFRYYHDWGRALQPFLLFPFMYLLSWYKSALQHANFFIPMNSVSNMHFWWITTRFYYFCLLFWCFVWLFFYFLFVS